MILLSVEKREPVGEDVLMTCGRVDLGLEAPLREPQTRKHMAPASVEPVKHAPEEGLESQVLDSMCSLIDLDRLSIT